MAETVTKIDKAGRVVIPKEIRVRMGLKEDSALLIVEADKGVVVLKKLDVEELARRLRRELKGVDVEAIAERVEEESNERARKAHKTLRNRH
ncbi:MAG: AbrB/MazE/SpoVT family DNA-binding domain-containing protein [Thaumarchaeota archaeon]|nr:AbrB/MazE/SpoVT family DNA-binding domain-containing protein [Nitrososphaerota archaeon]